MFLTLKRIHRLHFDSLESTNTWVKAHIEELDLSKYTCVTASEQTAGRGRFNRMWLSPNEQNIYATLFFTVPSAASYVSNLGQLFAYTCAVFLNEQQIPVQLKWPNDLLLKGHKIGGILVETTPVQDQRGIILGFGLNVNMSKESLQAIDQPAISLSQFSGHPWPKEQILDSILYHFLLNLDQLAQKGFAVFRDSFEQLLAFKGESITCFDGSKTIQGICKSITAEGLLQVLLPSHETVLVTAGELG